MANRRDEVVARVAAMAYWRAEDARVVVDAWRRSQQGVGEFARRNGIHPRRLSRWAQQLDVEEPMRFHPVRWMSEEGVAERGTVEPLEIVLGRGRSVRVPPGFAAEDLRRVLSVLAGEDPC